MAATEDFAWCRRIVESWKSYRPRITITHVIREGLSLVFYLRMNGLLMSVKYSLPEIRNARAAGSAHNITVKLDAARRAMETPEPQQREFPWLIPPNAPWVWDGVE